VAKPTKHGDKWRIRWLDERGERQSTDGLRVPLVARRVD
jgi:hypothetical protein